MNVHCLPTTNLVVTPKLNEKSNLTTEAQKNIMQRQLTMQLMPMYRVRQKSASIRPAAIKPMPALPNQQNTQSLIQTASQQNLEQLMQKVPDYGNAPAVKNSSSLTVTSVVRPVTCSLE